MHASAHRSAFTSSASTDKLLADANQTWPGVSLNSTASANALQQVQLSRQQLHFPVLVPLWRIYVQERPLPIFLHTTFMTVAALLWPLQVTGITGRHAA